MFERKIINDPVFGFINIPKGLLYDIVRHPLLQRLNRIKQLGLSSVVYPGAQHTRFQHSLGAFHLTSEAVQQLASKGNFIFDSEAEAVQAAILMHDIGHGPFSHVLEDTIVQGVSHEDISLMLMERINKEMNVECKSDYLQCGEHYELSELYPDEFVELLFERKAFEQGEGIIPFEEVQSYEYQLWLKQKIRNKALRSESSNSEDAQSEKIDYSGYRMWRYNPVVFYKDGKKNRHRLLLKDDGESLSFLNGRDFAILSPVTYVGRTNSYRNARFLYAFAIDLDGVSMHEVRMLLRGMTTGVYPVANIIVNSGHGIHVYYLLKRPIEMFATRLDALNKMKRGLTKIVWLVSKLGAERAQVQSVVQGFRVPGTKESCLQ